METTNASTGSSAPVHAPPQVIPSGCAQRAFGEAGTSGTVRDKEHDNKSAPVGAPTPDDRGLADREEHDRLMRSLTIERYARNTWWTGRKAAPKYDDSEIACARRRRELLDAWSEHLEEAR